jgi:hypothetical protein
MPYKSDKQRKFMHARHPDIAARWDAEIRGKRKRKKVSKASETRLRHQKKASAITSLAGGTAGLAGLGLLAARRPKEAAIATTISGGVGGVGAYNFASIQNQESKKRGPKQNVYVVRNKRQIKSIKSGLEPVKKGLDMMDFGLSDVHQGETVLIAKRDSHAATAKRRDDQANAAATVGGAGVLGAYGADVAGTVGYVKGKNFPTKYQGTILRERGKEGIGGYRSARAGTWSPEFGKPIPRRKLVKPMAQFAGKSIKASRHAVGIGAGLGVGAAGFGTAVGLAHNADKHKKAAKAKRVETAKAASWIPKTTKRVVGEGANQVKIKTRTTASNPLYRAHHKADYKYASGRHDTVGGGFKLTTAGKVTAGGVGATGVGGTALVATRKKKETTPELVGKAYNPEAKRERRLEHTSTAMAVGAGGAAGGAGVMGHRAVRSFKQSSTSYKAGLRSEATRRSMATKPGPWKPVGQHPGGGKAFVASRKALGAGGRQTAAATALGAGAVGLAVGAERVRRYKGKKGSTYKPLSRITAS